MYEPDFIQRLKRTNVSADGDKTKERIEQLWKGASNELKEQIKQDTGNTRASIYRVYQVGSISAKMAVSFAQRFNSDPYYLTGETDENGGYSEEVVERFLRDKGYSKLLDDTVAATRPKRKYQKRKETIVPNQVVPDDEAGMANDSTASSDADKNLGIDTTSDAGDKNIPIEITEEDMVALLHALIIRARVNAQGKEQLEKIKQLLLF